MSIHDPAGPEWQEVLRRLEPEAVLSILDAPGSAVPYRTDVHRDRLIDTLRALLVRALSAALETQASEKAYRKIEDSYRLLMAAYAATEENDRTGLPSLPARYQREMNDWLAQRSRKPARSGKRIDALRARIFQDSLAFYRLCYGQDPTASFNGPATRFMTRLMEVAEHALFDPPAKLMLAAGPSVAASVRERLTISDADAVRRAIRDYFTASARYRLPAMQLFVEVRAHEGLERAMMALRGSNLYSDAELDEMTEAFGNFGPGHNWKN